MGHEFSGGNQLEKHDALQISWGIAVGSAVLLSRSTTLEMVLSLSLCANDIWFRLKLSQCCPQRWNCDKRIQNWRSLHCQSKALHSFPTTFNNSTNQELACFLTTPIRLARRRRIERLFPFRLRNRPQRPNTCLGSNRPHPIRRWSLLHRGRSQARPPTLRSRAGA